MLDPYLYRANETAAKADPALGHRAAAHSVDHFIKIGFPVRINSHQEAGPLLNSMQEKRAAIYMSELGGITPHEHDLLLESCRDIVSFQRLFFPLRKPVLPLSVLMSVLCLYSKLVGINPAFSSVLEIGPGCGYLSFFLRQHAALASYCQIEACESFYILQNLVNLYCFGGEFIEHAFAPNAMNLDNSFWLPFGQFEIPPAAIRVPHKPPKCEHFAWWHIDEVKSRKFQIVTSNANLLEFSPAALEDYLGLIVEVLEPNGALVAQCCGSHVNGTLDTLYKKTEQFGLSIAASYTVNNINNAVWVKQGATLAARARPQGRRMYSMRQIIAETGELL